MADIEDDVDVLIEDPAKKPDGDVEVVKADEAPAKAPTKVLEPDEGLEKLRAELERERSGRVAAEKEAREASDSAAKARNEVQDSNLHLVTNAIETVRQSNEILKANYRDAMAAGDYDKVADLQLEMSSNAAKLQQLEQGKIALEAQPKRAAERRQADPVESFAQRLSPRSAEWVRRHPQFVTDPRLNQKMVAAHNLAEADGHAIDSDDYFDAIEDTLRLKQRQEAQEPDGALSAAAEPTQRRSAPPAAPVSRSGQGSGQRPNTVRLTAAEREIAALNGMTDVEYARNKLALQGEGKLN